MRPAFTSNRHAAGFSLLLAVLLGLPAIVGQSGWRDRRDVYPAIPPLHGAFPFIQQKIFAETTDVDVAFLGSSRIWFGVNTPYVKQEFSKRLGREAEVFTLGWGDNGFDAVYIIAKDLLDHRHVRMLVIYDEDVGKNAPHPKAFYWFRMGDDAEDLSGLSILAKLRLYASSVLGTPRHLLSAARPNLLEDPARYRPSDMNIRFHAPNFAEQDGALRSRLAFDWRPDLFTPVEPKSDAKPGDVIVYSAEVRDKFRFTSLATKTSSVQFVRKLARLCQERGTRLIFLHIPILNEYGEETICESQLWPELLEAPADIIGIPAAKLFAGIPHSDVPQLFLDNIHLNQNGQDLFTPLITPALYELCFPAHP